MEVNTHMHTLEQEWNRTYSRRQYKVSVPCRLPTVLYLKKTPSKTVPFYSAGRDVILLLYAIRI